MAYRYDDDLKFMDRASHDDLQDLVYVLTHDPKDGETRWTEELSSKLKNCRDHHDLWQEIAGELQCFGGDTFANMMRGGKGVVYRELLCDVCDSFKVKYDKKDLNIENIENALDAWQMSKLWDGWDTTTKNYYSLYMKLYRGSSQRVLFSQIGANMAGAALIPAFSALMGAGGVTSLMMSQCVSGFTAASITGASLASMTGIGGTAFAILAPRAAGFLIPPLAIFSLLSFALAFSGPAYRVTFPACLQVASLRKKVALTPREILKMQTIEKRVRDLQEMLKANENEKKRLMHLHIFALKVMEEFGLDIRDDIPGYIYGLSNSYEAEITEAENEYKNMPLDKALQQILSDGNSKAGIISLIGIVANLGGLEEDSISRMVARCGL